MQKKMGKLTLSDQHPTGFIRVGAHALCFRKHRGFRKGHIHSDTVVCASRTWQCEENHNLFLEREI
jgi:hypothetical protein